MSEILKAVQERPLSNFLTMSTMLRTETTEELTKEWPKAAINHSDSVTKLVGKENQGS